MISRTRSQYSMLLLFFATTGFFALLGWALGKHFAEYIMFPAIAALFDA